MSMASFSMLILSMGLGVHSDEFGEEMGEDMWKFTSDDGGRHACNDTGCWSLTWVLSCQKCGTTSLANALNGLRLACYANVTGINEGKTRWHRKETHFFDNLTVHGKLDYPLSSYLELFPEAWVNQCDSFQESTPQNFPNPEIGALLVKAMPRLAVEKMKFITVLREPIARDLSGYNMMRQLEKMWVPVCPTMEYPTYEAFATCELENWHRLSNGTINDKELSNAFRVSGLWTGMYYHFLKGWLVSFQRNKFLILNFDHLIQDSELTLVTVHAFLKDMETVPPPSTRPQTGGLNHRNDAQDYATPPQSVVSCEIVNRLNGELFDHYNSKLYEMIENDHREGLAPPVEPLFGKFQPHSCV